MTAECPRKEALRRTRGRIFSPHTRELPHRGESLFANYRYTRSDFSIRISPTTELLLFLSATHGGLDAIHRNLKARPVKRNT